MVALGSEIDRIEYLNHFGLTITEDDLYPGIRRVLKLEGN